MIEQDEQENRMDVDDLDNNSISIKRSELNLESNQFNIDIASIDEENIVINK